MKPKILVCSCEKTMPVDLAALKQSYDGPVGPLHFQLCRAQLGAFEAELEGGEQVTVACTAEAPLFGEVAAEAGAGDRVRFANIRENAGWSDEAGQAAPKIAALLSDAAREPRPARLRPVSSDGLCLVYGKGQQALEVAELLSGHLSVTVLLTDPADAVLPLVSSTPVYRGRISAASGALGGFSVTVDGYAPLTPSSRRELKFGPGQDGAASGCSLILDISGEAPLFPGHRHRDGYRRVDPGDPAAVLRSALQLTDMAGEFEKPIYVDYVAETCAHARSRKTGCTKCIDACPAGAILPSGDGVEISQDICGGCGACAALCPTGSISYNYPQRADMIGRVQELLKVYRQAGGNAPVLLVHDSPFGEEMIAAIARAGRGLPARVIPLGLHRVTTAGHVEILSWLAGGAAQVMFLADPAQQEELTPLESEVGLSGEILEGLGFAEVSGRIGIIAERDPETVERMLWSLPVSREISARAFVPEGSKRDVARTALSVLAAQAPSDMEILPLRAGAPYGRVRIDQEACTLCMACSSACPSAAIIDTPGEPRLRLVESACVQCGLCVTTCPENALSLDPRLNLSPAAMQPVTLYEEEPFECISCGKPFATGSVIERVKKQLAGAHPMFASPERARLIEMCDDCRIEAQANSSDDPFAVGNRPKTRTTDDYLKEEKDGLSPDDFLMDD